MWLITPVGFFSVVRKPTDIQDKTLTVRSRVRADLEALKTQYLPELGAIQESQVNDYRFRATASQAAVAAAMARLVENLDYANFKDEVHRQQGAPRARLYHDVWATLHRLQGVKGLGKGEGASGDGQERRAPPRCPRAGGPS